MPLRRVPAVYCGELVVDCGESVIGNSFLPLTCTQSHFHLPESVSESLRLNSTNWRGGFSECAKGTLFLALTIRERSSRKSIRKVQRNYEVFQRLYRCLDKARIPRRSQLNEEQDLSEPERLHPMSLSSLKPKKTSALQIGSREGGEASLVEHLPSVKIGLVLHLSTDRASLADWAFSAEFQDSGTKKFLFITGRIRLSILVLEKWVVLPSPSPSADPGGLEVVEFPTQVYWLTFKALSVSFYPIEAVVPIATVLRPLVGVLSAALAVEFFLISSATSRGLLTRLCFLSGPLLNKNVGRKSVRRLSVGKAKASLLLLLELHKKDGSGEKSYPQAFAYRMVEGGRGSNTFRLMLDHCIRDISNELSDL
ncbi:hypothetical protein L1987_89860 [Smallanthus sonchifolius]|nr:hypothetical protein L1987_89860 [Smallanthus sonchifolius]